MELYMTKENPKLFVDAIPSLNNVLQSLAIQHGVQPEDGNTRLVLRPLNYSLPHRVHVFQLRLPDSGLHRLHLSVVRNIRVTL